MSTEQADLDAIYTPDWKERIEHYFARGEQFATVGLSQLTTARQHTAPSFTARLDADTILLDGVIPWVTGAARAQHLIVGAVLADGRQVLALLPADLPGVIGRLKCRFRLS